MALFAVIDTETTWSDRVMSIGIVLAQPDFRLAEQRYYILDPEYKEGGMFSATLIPDRRIQPRICSRKQALSEIRSLLSFAGVTDIFAYNAGFDRRHLPELKDLCWYDIMRIAAYRQTNPYLPAHGEYCSTGKLKRGYGVEDMLCLLSQDRSYRESHNALYDALDELRIMRLLGRPAREYIPL